MNISYEPNGTAKVLNADGSLRAMCTKATASYCRSLVPDQNAIGAGLGKRAASRRVDWGMKSDLTSADLETLDAELDKIERVIQQFLDVLQANIDEVPGAQELLAAARREIAATSVKLCLSEHSKLAHKFETICASAEAAAAVLTKGR